MGKVSLAVFLVCLIESACLIQSHASWYKTFHDDKLLQKKHKVVRLQFYLHDNFSGDNVTTMQIAEGPNTSTSATGFGSLFMADNPLTAEQSPTSELIGRAQGLHAIAGMFTSTVVLVTNFVFTSGKYNGSSLALLGALPTAQFGAEAAIIGGTGAFKFASGYATSGTVFISASNNAIAQFNVTAIV